MSDDLTKVQTERGNGRSLTPYDVNVSYGTSRGSGADWFGPLAPSAPLAPPEVAGRAWDFIPGYNLATSPRAFEQVSFPALRQLAEAYDPVRLIIERRKDQLCRVPWTIRCKHDDPTTKRPKATQLTAETRERIADITRLFKRPSYGETFRTFLRAILEDLLVLDAPSIYLQRDSRGSITGLQWLDGATIRRVLDDWGRTPEPREWSGETFTWNGQMITCENFTQMGWRYFNGYAWPTIAAQTLKGLSAVNYSALELIYRPLNVRPGHAYGYSPTEQILSTVAIAMRRAQSQLAYFTEGNQPDAIYSLPPTWGPDQIQRLQDYWDALYSGNLANRRKLKFTADGKYTALKEPPLKNEIDEWLVRIVCFAFSYPPSAFVSLSNRSIAESHEKQSEEEGLGTLQQWAAELFNEIIEQHIGHEDIEFAWLEDDEVDQEKQATILGALVDRGIISRNTARERLGEEPDPNPAANELMVTTASGVVPIGGVEPEASEPELERLHKFTWIELKPPKNLKKIPKRIPLTSGYAIPDAGGRVRVVEQEDAELLERDGWSRAN